MTIDRDKAGLLGVPLADVDRSVRLGLAGLEVGPLPRRGPGGRGVRHRRDAAARRPHDARRASTRWTGSTLTTALGGAGAAAPARRISSSRARPPPSATTTRSASVTVTADVRAGFNTDRVTQEVLAKLASVKLPAGLPHRAGRRDTRAGRRASAGSARRSSWRCSACSRCWCSSSAPSRAPLIVASVIPLGVIGGLLALCPHRQHALLHRDDRLRRADRHRGEELHPAGGLHQPAPARRAWRSTRPSSGRARRASCPSCSPPLTAIGGLLPLALENSSLYSPLAWVIIGGLVSSTLLTRLVTPVLYELLAPEVEVEPAPATTEAPAQLAPAAAA